MKPATPSNLISRRTALSCLGSAAAAATLSWPLRGSAQAAEGKRPNFMLIVADDMGFSDAGCYGGEIETPNLDKLAQNGLRFSQFYSTGRCWPSRSCIMTGYYPQQIRADPPKGRHPGWAHCLPKHLAPLGYRSYQSGKWHVPGAPGIVEDAGFADAYNKVDENNHFKEHGDKEPDGKYYSATAVADHAISQLQSHTKDHAGQPFFSYVAFIVPHFPLHAMQEDIDRYRERYLEGWDVCRERRHKRLREAGIVNCALSPLDPQTIPPWNLKEAELQKRIGPGEEGNAVPWASLTDEQKKLQATKMAIHAAMIDRMDRNIGRLVDQLKAMNELENTVIFFVSDNGASAEQIIRGGGHDPAAAPGSAKTFLCLGPGWSTASNTPFRLHKSWTHEGGIASPLIVHWPTGLKAKGELRHDPGHFVDFLPTMIELAGGARAETPAVPEAPPFPGRSLVPAFAADGKVTHEGIYWHHLSNRALRVGDWKLVSGGSNKTEPWELYDLKTDRCELNNLAAKQPEKAKELTEVWEKLENEFRTQAGPAGPAERKGVR
jgi:arylsulfatase